MLPDVWALQSTWEWGGHPKEVRLSSGGPVGADAEGRKLEEDL